MTTLAGEGQKILVVAVFAFHPGKAIAQIATVQVPVHDLLEIGPQEAIGPLKSLFILLEEGLRWSSTQR